MKHSLVQMPFLCMVGFLIASFQAQAEFKESPTLLQTSSTHSNLSTETHGVDPQILSKVQLNIFQNDHIFDDNAVEVAQRLGLPPEAKTKYMTSFRSYNPINCDVFEQKPSMAALYGNPEKVSEINLMFLNEGDFFGVRNATDPKSQTNIETEMRKKGRPFTEAMRAQENIFLKNLTNLLGKPTSATMGMEKTAERVTRWDIQNTAILLSVHDQHFIALRIWPKSMADNRGLLKGLTDEELRKECKSNVTARSNNDVIIKEIPMIDQGPKGFCVPATYERVLRYLGMNADMYTLAMVGEMKRGSGTLRSELNNTINHMIQRSGRQIRVGIPFTYTDIKRWINQGIPLLWGVMVVDHLEQLSNEQTQQRNQTPFEQWEKMVRKFDPPKNLKLDPKNAHVRLIIGYNEKTREIAYSDSFGKEFEERWITFNSAKAISRTDTLALSAITW